MTNGSILVTGASGFIGTRLVKALRARGDSVVTHSRSDGDLAHAEPQVQGTHHVYHLAARTYVPDSWKAPYEFYEANVLSTVNVVEFCRKRGNSLTLLSSFVYGHPEHLPITEDHPLAAFNPYAHSKILAEEVGRFYETAFGVPVTVVRAFNPYGPGQAERFLIPSLIAKALSAEGDSVIIDDDRPRRDFLYIDDLIDLLLALSGGPSGVYNAGSGASASVKEVADLVIKMAGTGKSLVSRGLERKDEVMNVVADISRARREVGWNPKISLEEGLRRTVESMRPTVVATRNE